MLVALLTSLLMAAPPQISGVTSVDQYKLVQLTVSNAAPEAAVLWDVYPEDNVDIREFADGLLIFTAPPGDYKIKLRLISGRQVDTLRTVVTIKGTPPAPGPNPGPNPTPNPGPGPGPNPSPVLPDGKFKLASKAVLWSSTITSANKAAEAAALAGALEGTVAAANAGAIKTIDEFLAAGRDANRQALSTSSELWKPWFTNLKNECETLYSAGLLNTLEDNKTAFAELAIGLRSVK